MRIMLVTNILISIIFFPSGVTREFTRQVGLGNRIVLCDYVIEELPFELVCTPKDLNLEDFPAVRDSKDTPILATAILENIDILITGDKDLRVVETEYPEIMTMSEFIEKY